MTPQTSLIVALCIPIHTRSFVSAQPGIGATNPQEIGQRGQRARPRSVSKLVAEAEFWPRSPGPISTECKPKAQKGGIRGFLTELEEIYGPPHPFFQRTLQSLLHYSRQVGEGERGQATALQGVKTSGGWGLPQLVFVFVAPCSHRQGCVCYRVRNKIPCSASPGPALCVHSASACHPNRHIITAHTNRGVTVCQMPLYALSMCVNSFRPHSRPIASLLPPFHRRGNQGTKEEILCYTPETNVILYSNCNGTFKENVF